MDVPPTADQSDVHPIVDKDLTEQEIHQLLVEAESRMRSLPSPSDNFSSLPASESKPQSTCRTSKLSLGYGIQPYINRKDRTTAVEAAQIPLQTGSSNMSDMKVVGPANSSTKEKPTAGSDWFNLPKTELTPELKRDLQLIRMRSVLDPKRHYKKESSKAQVPEFSQVGTVIHGRGEFFSARILKKDRKKNLVDETLALERQTRRFSDRYMAVQLAKQSGKKAFYNSVKAKRKSKGK